MKTTYTYTHFYLHQEITDVLKGYAEKYPQYIQLESLNKTPEGRDIWAVTLTNLQTGCSDDKPAYCIDGNVHAGEVTGAMCAMYFLDYVLTNLNDKTIQNLLSKYTFYVVPRISPDGSEAYLTTPAMLRSVNRMYPFDEPQPGVQPADLDGDGVIRKMRIKSPYGGFKKSDKDPRVMIKRRPDDTEGDFYHIFYEGIFEKWEENDSGHIFNAPAQWANDFNRNFPSAWLPESGQRGAGVYPLYNVETKTIADFFIAHKNIFCVTNFHTAVGVYLYPPGFKHATEAIKEDMDRYREMGIMATQETGYPVVSIRDEYMNPKSAQMNLGSMDDYTHFVLGLFDYTVECWDLNPRSGIEVTYPMPLETPQEKTEEMAHKHLAFVDKELGGEGYMDWTPFEHPQFGTVEIGGLDTKKVVQNCPPKLLLQECEKHTRFMLRHVKALPQLIFRNVTAQNVEGNVYRITADVANVGYLPTYGTKESLKLKIQQDIHVDLLGDVQFVQGLQSQNIGQLEGYSAISSNSFGGVMTDLVNPCEKRITWVVQAKPGTTLTVKCHSKKVGTYTSKITL